MGGPWEDYQSQVAESAPWEDYAKTVIPIAEKPTETTPEPSALSNRMGNIADIWSDVRSEVYPGQTETALESFAKSGGRVFRTGGQVAGLVNDVVSSVVMGGIRAIYEAATPEAAQDAFADAMKSVAQSGTGQTVIDGMRKIQDAYGKFKSTMPEAAGNIEAAGNYAGVVPSVIAGRAAITPIKKGAEILKGAVTPMKTVATLDTMIDSAIEAGIKKGIRPSVVGKQTAEQVKRYYDNAKMAVRDIVENADELPQSLADFSKSVLDTRKKIYSQYHTMAQGADAAGATVDLTPIINEMDILASNAKLRRVNADTANWLAEKVAEWKTLPTIVDPSEAEDMIASLNASTKAFWKNPNFNDTSRVALTEGMTKQLRKATDDAIEAYQGPGYQELKNRYGALKSIEKEVTDRATVDARKNLKGFFDIADIASAGEFAYGLTKMDPASMVAAATMRGMKNYIKHLNDPNRIVRDMFEKTGKLIKVRNRIANP